jgi:hypothetical protein
MPDAPTPEPLPQVVIRKHRLTLIVAIIVVVVIIIAIAGGALWFLWQSNQTPGSNTTNGTLPTGAVGQPNTNTSSTSPAPLPDRAAVLAQNQSNLVVTINYTSRPQFKLSVSDIQRTYQVDPADLYAPVTGSPYSKLKIYDTNNNVILERPFAITTGVIAEGEGATTGGQTTVDSSQAVISLKMPDGVTPQKIEIVSSSGQLFDTRTFVFEQLPIVFDAQL